MMDFIRDNQNNVMLCLSSVCAVVTLFMLITGISGRKKRALLILEIGAMFLLMSDRYTYIFDGDVSSFGYWMMRINTFLDYFMTLVVVLAFNLYLKEMFAEGDGIPDNLRRFKINSILLIAGMGLVILSQFTGFYYTFDETNHYHRGPGVAVCFIVPVLALVLQLSLIFQYYKRLSKSMRLSVLLFAIMPFLASIVQFFIYGIESTNITIVGMAVLLYIFDLKYINETAVMSERAIAASEAKSAFLSNMSHEIRTPINAVLGMNEMILRECDDPAIITYSENIKTAGSTLLGLINDILDFSKIEAGKIEIIPVDYDLSSVINDLVNMIATRADNKGLELKLNFDNDIPKFLNGDEVRIKQIITNILTNAVKYTEKGSVTFSIGYEKPENDPGSVILKVSVKDTGIGIKKEDMKKLFSEFERIEEERNRKIEGTGLGMSITTSLLEMMGSSLQVDSIYGEGSDFHFAIKQRVIRWDPLGDYEASYKEHISKHEKYKETFTAPNARILVVDDNPMNLVVFKSLIKQTQIKIDTADDGDKGILLTHDVIYDIIFLDHMMPGKDGIEVLHQIKSEASNPNLNTPYICLTANAISGAREQYIAEGFNDYLTKPIDPDHLEEMIIRLLPDEKVIMSSQNISDDKEETAPESNPASPADISTKTDLDLLDDQDLIDVSCGIKNSGSKDAYLPILKMVYDSCDAYLGEIHGYYTGDNIKDYTVKVHALKSTARIIGALGIGEEAQALENAGKENDLEYINAHHGEFMEKYGLLKVILAPLFEPDAAPEPEPAPERAPASSGKPEADADLMMTVLDEIKGAASQSDIDTISAIFDEMEEFSIPGEYEELYNRIKAAADDQDFNTITDLINERV